ncbi:MAG: DUF438 domain-containing protein, partial [Anaerolineales bacterium]
RRQLVNLLTKIPYGEVVEVEQELISEGTLTEDEVLKFCDIHSEALNGAIDLSGMKIIPPGHPVDTFKRENLFYAESGRTLSDLRDSTVLIYTFDKLIKKSELIKSDYDFSVFRKFLVEKNKNISASKHKKSEVIITFRAAISGENESCVRG